MWNFLYVTHFELQKIQLVRFWIQKSKKRHILNLKKYNASDFEFKEVQRVRFWI